MSTHDPLRPGPRDHLLTRALVRVLESVDPSLVDRLALDGAEGPRRLARHLAAVIERELAGLGDDRDTARRQAELVNALLGSHEEEMIIIPPEVWTGLRAPATGLSGVSA